MPPPMAHLRGHLGRGNWRNRLHDKATCPGPPQAHDANRKRTVRRCLLFRLEIKSATVARVSKLTGRVAVPHAHFPIFRREFSSNILTYYYSISPRRDFDAAPITGGLKSLPRGFSRIGLERCPSHYGILRDKKFRFRPVDVTILRRVSPEVLRLAARSHCPVRSPSQTAEKRKEPFQPPA